MAPYSLLSISAVLRTPNYGSSHAPGVNLVLPRNLPLGSSGHCSSAIVLAPESKQNTPFVLQKHNTFDPLSSHIHPHFFREPTYFHMYFYPELIYCCFQGWKRMIAWAQSSIFCQKLERKVQWFKFEVSLLYIASSRSTRTQETNRSK